MQYTKNLTIFRTSTFYVSAPLFTSLKTSLNTLSLSLVSLKSFCNVKKILWSKNFLKTSNKTLKARTGLSYTPSLSKTLTFCFLKQNRSYSFKNIFLSSNSNRFTVKTCLSPLNITLQELKLILNFYRILNYNLLSLNFSTTYLLNFLGKIVQTYKSKTFLLSQINKPFSYKLLFDQNLKNI